METKEPFELWRFVMQKKNWHYNEIIHYRLRSVYKELCYLTNKTNRTPPDISFYKENTLPTVYEKNILKSQIKRALVNANAVLTYLENEVLLKPKNWSKKKYNVVQHYVADVIGYIVEDLEKELRTA